MAMERERLHNFTMPCGLRWGNQRFLRCMKVNSDGEISADHRRHRQIQQRRTMRGGEEESFVEFLDDSPKVGPTPFCPRQRFSVDGRDGGEDGIAAMREKVMLDLQTAAGKIKDAIFKDGFEEGEISAPSPPPPPPPPPQTSADTDGEAHCPWNLRTRRASSRPSGFLSSKNVGSTTAASGGVKDVGGGKTLRIDAPLRPNSGSSQMRAAPDLHHKLLMHRTDGNAAAAAASESEQVKFSLPLSKREIEEDFFGMVGHRPPRRPKKRARTVQKQLDTLFPGLTLTNVTPDKYKVNEAAP